MTSPPSPTPHNPASDTPAERSAGDAALRLLDGADAEIEEWQYAIVEIGEQHSTHPGINRIRFESANRATAPLDQLQALLHDVLDDLGIARRPPAAGRHRAPDERPRSGLRRWPAELAGVPESHLQGEHLKNLTYAQLHALTMADHPDEVTAMADQWLAISQAAWQRGSQLGDLAERHHGSHSLLARLAEAYQGFAARTDHYGKTFADAAASQQEARRRMEELGPP